MAEETCTTCQGDGLSKTPHPIILPNGQPSIEIRIGTCSTCTGNGKVNR